MKRLRYDSRQHRSSRHSLRQDAAAVSPGIPSPAGGGGISAGQQSQARGFVYFPNLKAKYHFARAPRLEVIKKARWLCFNDGNGRLLRRLAEWIGPVTVEPDTRDIEWNEEMKKQWDDEYVDAFNFDASGKFTAESYQAMINFMNDRDGDVLNCFTEKDSGEPTVCLYDSTSIGDRMNGSSYRGGDWFDGVKVDKLNRHLSYSLLPEDYSAPAVIIPADRTMMFSHYEVPESVRGTCALVHAVDNVLDMRQMTNDIKKMVLIQGLFGVVIKSPGTLPMKPAAGKMVRADLPASNIAGEGTEDMIPRYKEQIFDGSGITRLPGGAEMDFLTDKREMPSQREIKEDLYVNIAQGLGVRVQFLWLLEKLTGPGFRFVLADVQDWRDRRLKRMVPFVKLDYARRVEWKIRTRQIRAPKDPDFWRCQFTFPRALTIDTGRDNAGRIKALEKGLTNWRNEFGEQGDQWRPEIKQRLEEIHFALDEIEGRKRDAERAAKVTKLFFGDITPPAAAAARAGTGAKDPGLSKAAIRRMLKH